MAIGPTKSIARGAPVARNGRDVLALRFGATALPLGQGLLSPLEFRSGEITPLPTRSE